MIAVAYQKWSLMRGFNYKALTGKLWEVNRTSTINSCLSGGYLPGAVTDNSVILHTCDLSHVK